MEVLELNQVLFINKDYTEMCVNIKHSRLLGGHVVSVYMYTYK